MSNQQLQAQKIGKSYKEKEVLKDLDLTLEPGKIYGLIGRNGAGKTTLLSILSAQAKASSGSVYLGTEPVWENQKALDHICFSRELGANMANNMLMGLKIKEYFNAASLFLPHWDQNMANDLLKEFELDSKQRLAKLSKGMLSMVTIIIAMASKADYTFLDEPVAGLDVIMRERFYKLLLEEYTESGRTFVISTHIIDEATEVLEEVIVLNEGKIVLKENTQQLLQRAYHITGREDEVEKAVEGLKVYHKEHFGRSVSLMILLEPGQTFTRKGNLDVQPVNLQKVFLALCGKGEES